MQAICSCFGVIFLVGMVVAAQAIHGRDGITLPAPPAVDASPVTDNYFGTKIVDNYRWLEDAKSPETQAFIDAQNAYTERYLKQARIRSKIADDLDALRPSSNPVLAALTPVVWLDHAPGETGPGDTGPGRGRG